MIRIEKYTDEERKFFTKQIQSVHNELFRMLLVRTSSDQVAEELIQEICYRAWKSFHTLKDRNNFRGWIKVIMDYTVKDYYRKKYREREILEFQEDPESNLPDSVEDIGDISYLSKSKLETMKDVAGYLIRRENRETVCRVLFQMKPSYQNLLKLYLLEEMSYKEIAGLTGIKEGTVQVQIHRGLKKLAELYHKIDEEGSE